MANSKYEYVKKFEADDKLLPSIWIVVRIDGRGFHRFSAAHEFDKPNDENALNLMNSCAISMLEEFPEVVFAYGVSDEYSFILKKTTDFYQRRSRLLRTIPIYSSISYKSTGFPDVVIKGKILSVIVSYFTSLYVMKWKDFFPTKELRYPPCFDGRVICYPDVKILQDYLSWRQADCHINNQYNTCFWMLVKSGKTEKDAQEELRGTQTKHKNELLFKEFKINYNTLPAIFRKGSCVYRDKVGVATELDESIQQRRRTSKVTVEHCDIINPAFWNKHPHILGLDGEN